MARGDEHITEYIAADQDAKKGQDIRNRKVINLCDPRPRLRTSGWSLRLRKAPPSASRTACSIESAGQVSCSENLQRKSDRARAELRLVRMLGSAAGACIRSKSSRRANTFVVLLASQCSATLAPKAAAPSVCRRRAVAENLA